MYAILACDAGPHTGGGHVVRSMALAGEMSQRGWRCSFAVPQGAAELIPALSTAGELFELATVGDVAAIQETRPEGCDVLVVDHYGLDAAFERACRGWARTIAVIDDLADRSHDCDLLLDQTPGRAEDDYRRLVPQGCAVFLGPQAALLRPTFAAARENALRQRIQSTKVSNIVISFGATDSASLTARAVEGLIDVVPADTVITVLGGKDRQNEASRGSRRLRFVPWIDDMAGLMAEADLAIGAAGSTSWERCCLGLPAVVVPVADNQKPIASFLQSRGAAVIAAPDPPNATPQALGRAAADLIANIKERQEMCAAAAQICNGSGAAMLATSITERVNGRRS